MYSGHGKLLVSGCAVEFPSELTHGKTIKPCKKETKQKENILVQVLTAGFFILQIGVHRVYQYKQKYKTSSHPRNASGQLLSDIGGIY